MISSIVRFDIDGYALESTVEGPAEPEAQRGAGIFSLHDPRRRHQLKLGSLSRLLRDAVLA